MSFPNWNADGSFNKITSTYFKDLIDLSGNFIIRNGTIKSPANTIEFDDTFSFINIPNSLNVLTQLKANYDSVEYDVGLQCEKVDTLVTDVGTISPIVYDSEFKLTGLYWDNGLTTTVFTNNVSFPNGSISSLAINNSSFVALSGAQSIDGIKTFNSAPVMSGGSITNGSIPSNKITGTAVNLNSAQSITATKTFTVAQTFSNNIRLDGSLVVNNNTQTITNAQLREISDISTLKTITTAINYTPATSTTLISNVLQFSGTLNGWNTTNFSNAINYAKDLTSSAQSQIGSLQTQIDNISGVSLSASNVFTGATNQFTNNIRLDGSLIVNNNGTTLTNDNLNRIQWLSGVSSSVSTSISNLNTSVSTVSTKCTNISYANVLGLQSTTITNSLISQVFSFTTSINNISTTVFGYLSGVSSSIQTQLNNLGFAVNPTGSIIMSPLSNLETTTSNKYLLCNGQNVSRTTYATLFSAIGTTFGSGDGSTTYSLPNYQGLFFRGMGSQTINSTTYTGVSVSSPQQDAHQNHTHLPQTGSYLLTTNSSSATGGYSSVFPATKPDTSNFANTGLMATGRSDTNETRPVNVGIYYYIKT
jgi:microcystin-dependent protein